MRISIGSSTTSLLAGVLAAFWLCGAARAGDGGEDLGSLNAFLTDTLCPMVGLSTTSCPQLPTISQAVLEIAALENAPPEIIEALNAVAPGNHPDAGNTAQGGVHVLPSIEFPLTVATLPDLLSTLTPLAFISSPNGAGPATATQSNDPIADTFLYAVASGSGALTGNNLPAADTLYLFYDDTQRTNRNLPERGVVAEFSLPLMVLNSDKTTERPVLTTLLFSVPGASSQPCSSATVQGDFLGNGTTQTKKATDIGLNCAVVFAPSPASPDPHAIFQLQVPLLVTRATDPTYFYSFDRAAAGGPVSLLIPTAFIIDYFGFTPDPGILGPLGKFIGIAPSAGPLCNGTACPTPTYSLCANLPRNHNKQAPIPAAAAFYAIATDGETHLLAPVVPSSPIVCPF
jgi:hypothetical protein